LSSARSMGFLWILIFLCDSLAQATRGVNAGGDDF
jgi:hypothetical protein